MAAQGRDGSTENRRADGANAPTNAMTVGTSQTCTHAHVLPMQQRQPSAWPAWLACALADACPAQCVCTEAGMVWPAQCAS